MVSYFGYDVVMTFGELFKLARKNHNLSLDKVSLLSGVHKSNICKYENGDEAPPSSMQRLIRLIGKLELTSEEMAALCNAAYTYHLGELNKKFIVK